MRSIDKLPLLFGSPSKVAWLVATPDFVKLKTFRDIHCIFAYIYKRVNVSNLFENVKKLSDNFAEISKHVIDRNDVTSQNPNF